MNKIVRSTRSNKVISKPDWLYSLPSLRCKWWLIGLDSRRAWYSLQLCHGAQRHRSQWLPASPHRDHTNWGGGLGLPHDCGQGAHQGVCAIIIMIYLCKISHNKRNRILTLLTLKDVILEMLRIYDFKFC